MDQFDIFTVRDLRERTGDLLRDAEAGRLALITKHGRPAFLAVPFDERLLIYGVNRAMAMHLYEKGLVTLSQAARISDYSLFMYLGKAIEFGKTKDLFTNPKDKKTEAYLTGQFG